MPNTQSDSSDGTTPVVTSGFAVPGWILALATFIGAVEVISGPIWYFSDYALHRLTRPVAGYSFRHSTQPTMKEVNGLHFVEYCCDNRGPAEVEQHSLKLIVSDKFNAEKDEFESGLTLSRQGHCDYTIKNDGSGTIIEVTPKSETLGVGARFGVMIMVPQSAWKPLHVHMMHPNGLSTDASGQLPIQSNSTVTIERIRNYAFVAFSITSAIGFLGLVILLFSLRGIVQRAIDKNIATVRKNIEAKGYNKGAADTGDEYGIADGKKESDQYEEAIREVAKEKKPSGAVPKLHMDPKPAKKNGNKTPQ